MIIKFVYFVLRGMLSLIFKITIKISKWFEVEYYISKIRKRVYLIIGVFFSCLSLVISIQAIKLNNCRVAILFFVLFIIFIKLNKNIERLYLCSNSVFYFLVMICGICLIVSNLIWYRTGKTPVVLTYFILCTTFSLIANKKVSILANEISSSILTLLYTIGAHYKEILIQKAAKALMFINQNEQFNMWNGYNFNTENIDGFMIERAIELVDKCLSSILILLSISIVSIVLLHLKEYFVDKYYKGATEKQNNTQV